MSVSKFPCKNHPQISSSRRCYLCKVYVCTKCEINAFHHRFCSYWCIIKFAVLNNFARLKFSKDILAITIIFLVIQVAFYFIIRWELKSEMEKAALPETSSYKMEINSKKIFSTDTTVAPDMNSIIISGKAPNNTLLGLEKNGKFCSAALSSKGKYAFQNQILSVGKNTFVIIGLFEDGHTAMVDSFSINYYSQRLTELSNTLDKIHTNENVLSLTFDAGATANGADSIINILQKKNLRTTFFLTGKFIQLYPEITKQLVSAGHEIANHTFNHPHLTKWEVNGTHESLDYVDRQYIYSILNKTDSIFNSFFNENLKPFWRAPFGEYNDEILSWAAEIGYRHIGWSYQCDTHDWVSDENSNLYKTPEEIFDRLMQIESKGKLKGAIILMHLGTNRNKDFPFQMLSKLIDSLRKKQYKFINISQLISHTIHI